jgi:MtN3 and saliva related transmembrane protein
MTAAQLFVGRTDLLTECIGITAAFLTTASFCPQVVKVWRTRDASSISASMYVMFTAGTAAWLVYGLMIHSLSVIAANAVSFCLAATVLFLKYRHSKASSIARRCEASGVDSRLPEITEAQTELQFCVASEL